MNVVRNAIESFIWKLVINNQCVIDYDIECRKKIDKTLK